MPRYPRRVYKGLANQHAGLDGNARVPTAQLGSGTAGATVFLRGDQSWAAVTFSVLTGTITDTQHGVRTLANAHAHADLSGVTSDQHHAQSHTHNADSSGDVAVLRVSGTTYVETLATLGLTFPASTTTAAGSEGATYSIRRDAVNDLVFNVPTGEFFVWRVNGARAMFLLNDANGLGLDVPIVFASAGTAPAGTVHYLRRDSGDDLVLNVPTGEVINFTINGGSIITFEGGGIKPGLDLFPTVNNGLDLGTSSLGWRDIFLGRYIRLGITDTNGTVEGQVWYDASEDKLKFKTAAGVETVTSI